MTRTAPDPAQGLDVPRFRAACAHFGIDSEVAVADTGRNVLVDPAGLERLRDRCAARGDTETATRINHLLDAATDS